METSQAFERYLERSPHARSNVVLVQGIGPRRQAPGLDVSSLKVCRTPICNIVSAATMDMMCSFHICVHFIS
jgi:trehalose-6-phosphate synthase